MEACNDELHANGRQPPDAPRALDEDARADAFREIRTLEVEFAHWARVFTVRARERDAAIETLGRLAETRRDLLVRNAKITQELTALRAHVPAAIGQVMGLVAATDAALDLNTSFEATEAHHSHWARVANMGKGT